MLLKKNVQEDARSEFAYHCDENRQIPQKLILFNYWSNARHNVNNIGWCYLGSEFPQLTGGMCGESFF